VEIKRYTRWTFFSLLSGLLAGLAATVFLYLLDWATNTRDQFPVLIWGLPIAGFIIGWVYYKWGQQSDRGNNLILDEIHDPQKTLPLRMAPLVLGGTLLTHLFGGSAGREGTAVQMGATLSDQLSKFFKIEAFERKILLVTGAGAGFGAAIGTPWAGVIFGMEVIQVGRLTPFAAIECIIASFVGYYTTVFLKAPHSEYPLFEIGNFDFKTFLFIAAAGIFFGLAARIFVFITHQVENLNSQMIRYPPLRPLVGGLLLVLFFYLESSNRYVGLGIPVIQEAFTEQAGFRDPALKAFFTALTVGSGFKGGEFIPLVFIGTTLGSALSVILPISFQLLAAVGFAAVFAGASNTPIACSIMAIELFGIEITPYALVACFISFFLSGKKSIYKSQRFLEKKLL